MKRHHENKPSPPVKRSRLREMRSLEQISFDVEQRCGARLTMDQLTFYQLQYASNPERLWKTHPDKFLCRVPHLPPETDTLLWKTTQQVGNMLSGRNQYALQAILSSVEKKEIDLKYVDCFLPVMRMPDQFCDTGCSNCNYSGGFRRKMSIVRAWISMHTFASEVMWDFFNIILLPTGLASRYNEIATCCQRSVLNFASSLGLTDCIPRSPLKLHMAFFVLQALPFECQLQDPKIRNLEIPGHENENSCYLVSVRNGFEQGRAQGVQACKVLAELLNCDVPAGFDLTMIAGTVMDTTTTWDHPVAIIFSFCFSTSSL